MDSLTLQPISHIAGEVTLPGSKSLSNRALLLAALAEGTTRITNLLDSDDVRYMLAALRQLGTTITLEDEGRTAIVRGHGGAFPAGSNEQTFYLGNAGTAVRPLTAALCLTPGRYRVDGDDQMRERPIAHLVDALRQRGAVIDYEGDPGCPPLAIRSSTLRGGAVTIDGSISSQYLTAMLMVMPLLPDDSIITVIGEQVSKPYLTITLDIMAKFGVHAEHDNFEEFRIPGGQVYRSPGDYMVEGDASSASYFLAAAAIRGGTVRVHGIGSASVQGDVRFADVLDAMGAEVTVDEHWVEVSGGELHGVDLDLNDIPDAAMTAATAALFAEGPTTLRNIYNWRVKETDRMTAMATELRKLGADVETGDDYIVINPPRNLQTATIDTYNDHRIAMSFSLTALGDVPVTINDPGCTAKTFPDYFELLGSISS